MSECYLLDRLPAELRLRIYEYVLTFDGPLYHRLSDLGDPNPYKWAPSCAAILATNRQIHCETLPVLYDRNAIVVSRRLYYLSEEGYLLKKTGTSFPVRKDLLRRVVLRYRGECADCRFRFLRKDPIRCEPCLPDYAQILSDIATLPRIQSVTIEVPGYYLAPSIRTWFRATAEGSAGEDFLMTFTDVGKGSLRSSHWPARLAVAFVRPVIARPWQILSVLPDSAFIPSVAAAYNPPYRVEGRYVDVSLKELYLLFYTQKVGGRDSMGLHHSAPWEAFRAWQAVEDARQTSGEANRELESLTDHLERFCQQAETNYRGYWYHSQRVWKILTWRLENVGVVPL